MTAKVDQLEALSKDATPGPWSDGGIFGEVSYVKCSKLLTETNRPTSIGTLVEADAELIAAMRNSIDDLIAVARAAEKLATYPNFYDGIGVEELRTALEKLK